jgi:hypothetical protein
MTGDLIPFKPIGKQARPRFNWHEAFLYFASDPKVTLGDVQKKLGCSYTTVRQRCKAEKWNERRNKLLAQVAANQTEMTIRSLEERHRRTIAVAEKLRDLILDPEAELAAKDAVSALPAYAKLEQLFGGGATENLRAMPMINPDNLTVGELEELARLLEKAQAS